MQAMQDRWACAKQDDVMGYRKFEDENGRQWEAWEVQPSVVERRINDERRGESRETPDRRQTNTGEFSIPARLHGGWLAFQTDSERRRLAPIPADWAKMTDREL